MLATRRSTELNEMQFAPASAPASVAAPALASKAPAISRREFERERARQTITFYGALLNGILSVAFLVLSIPIGVPLFPSGAEPYGSVFGVLPALTWIACAFIGMFWAPVLITTTLIVYVIMTLSLAGALIALFATATVALFSGNTGTAFRFGFVALPVAIQLVLALLTTVALWRLYKDNREKKRAERL